MEFPHLVIRLAYLGKAFAGFQHQKNSLSVQEVVEKALGVLFKERVRIGFTSRTDAGVHALDQWVFLKNAFEKYQVSLRSPRFLISLNALLPPEISAWSLLKVREDFHPKRSILWKEYEYRVFSSRFRDPLLSEYTDWRRAPLDKKILREALTEVEGTHDFAAFTKMRSARDVNTVRSILKAKISVKPHPIMADAELLIFRFRGSGFLHHMLRNLMGTLLEMGAGRPRDLKEIIKSRDRRRAGKLAPAYPLCLVKTQAFPASYQNFDIKF